MMNKKNFFAVVAAAALLLGAAEAGATGNHHGGNNNTGGNSCRGNCPSGGGSVTNNVSNKTYNKVSNKNYNNVSNKNYNKVSNKNYNNNYNKNTNVNANLNNNNNSNTNTNSNNSNNTNDNSSNNNNTNNNNSNASATATSSSTATSGEGGDGGSANITIGGDEAAASSAAPVYLTSSNDTCMGSSGVGGQGMNFGFSVGTTWTDSNCIMLKNARELRSQGHDKAAKARLCMDDDNAMAFELAGEPCPRALASSQAAIARVREWNPDYMTAATPGRKQTAARRIVPAPETDFGGATE